MQISRLISKGHCHSALDSLTLYRKHSYGGPHLALCTPYGSQFPVRGWQALPFNTELINLLGIDAREVNF